MLSLGNTRSCLGILIKRTFGHNAAAAVFWNFSSNIRLTLFIKHIKQEVVLNGVNDLRVSLSWNRTRKKCQFSTFIYCFLHQLSLYVFFFFLFNRSCLELLPQSIWWSLHQHQGYWWKLWEIFSSSPIAEVQGTKHKIIQLLFDTSQKFPFWNPFISIFLLFFWGLLIPNSFSKKLYRGEENSRDWNNQ